MKSIKQQEEENFAVDYLIRKYQKKPLKAQKNKIMAVRRDTYDLITAYQKEQLKKQGIHVRKIDILDIAIRTVIRHGDFLQYAIDFRKREKEVDGEGD